MSTPRDERQKDLFRPALDSIIDLNHPLVLLARRIDWTFLEHRLGGVYRPGIEPVIGHQKAEHRMGRNHLKGRDGDRINAVLAAVGYNFSLLLRWLAALLFALVPLLVGSGPSPQRA